MRSVTKRCWTMAASCAALTLAMSSLSAGSAWASVVQAGPSEPEQAAPRLTELTAGDARTVVSFTFDDGDVDQMTAAQVLRQDGLHGTFYIITGAIGAPNYDTLSDLHKLAADGDEIGGHTVSHLELPHVAPAEARRQLCDSRDILLRWGFHVTSFAYPGGVYSPAVEAMVRQCGFDSARTVAGLRSPGCPTCTMAETMPPHDPYAVRCAFPGRWTAHGRWLTSSGWSPPRSSMVVAGCRWSSITSAIPRAAPASRCG
jgi:peptidoglycan/xylan/chitin deacetylase (PgdA/CDA1 family)